MKRKIKKYLDSKENCDYDFLDTILEMYLSGKIGESLSDYSEVSIDPSLYRDTKSIQISYTYNNIYVIIDFFEDKYNVVIYSSGTKADDLEKLFIDYDYQEDFEITKLFNEIAVKIKEHPELKDITLIKKKKKFYSLIAWISWCLPIIFFGSIGLYGIITESAVKGNAWWGIFFVVFLMAGCFFDIKSKQL